MEGYSVTEAASILGVPTERVWELLARGILSGAPDGETGMRVFLQPRPAPLPPVVEDARQGGARPARETEVEASPFRELLTEFRNLTERYGQALLALGESRGEVASLRSRVDLLEARFDLRLPMQQPMPTPAAAAAAAWGAAHPSGQPEAAAREMPSDSHASTEAQTEEPGTRRRRGRGHRATDDFAQALARADDPTPAELPGAAEAAAAIAALRDEVATEADPERVDDATLPRELPAAEPFVGDIDPEPFPEFVVPPHSEPHSEPLVEADSATSLPETAAGPEPEPEPIVEPESVSASEETEAQHEPEAGLEVAVEAERGALVPEPVGVDAPESTLESESVADELRPDAGPSEAEFSPEPELETEVDVEPVQEMPADEPTEAEEAFEAEREIAGPTVPEAVAASDWEAAPQPETGLQADAAQPAQATEVIDAFGEPSWDRDRYSASIEEPDWIPDERDAAERRSPASDDPTAAEPAANEGPDPALPAPEEPPAGSPGWSTDDDTSPWVEDAPEAGVASRPSVDDPAAEMEVASTGSHTPRRAEAPQESPVEAPAQALAAPPAPGRVVQFAPPGVTSITPVSPASRAYRRLRRIFPS